MTVSQVQVVPRQDILFDLVVGFLMIERYGERRAVWRVIDDLLKEECQHQQAVVSYRQCLVQS